MSYFIWLIVGIILLTITIFIHKHTYNFSYGKPSEDDKLEFPMWLLLTAIVIAAIPILNLAAFLVGGSAYMSNLCEEEIEFHCESRWWKSLMGWLTKKV